VIPGLHELLSHLTYEVGFSNPGGLAILYLMGVLTDIGIPLLFTVEIFLLFASYYLGPTSIQVPLIILMLLLGRVSGGSVLYWLCYILGDTFTNWLKNHFSFLCRGLDQFRDRINEHTILAVTLVRLTPGFLQIPSIATGSLHLKYIRFILGVIFSSLIYDISVMVFGFIGHLVLGSSRQDLEVYFIVGFILLIIASWIFFFFKYRHSFGSKNARKS
jgi:membrane protein DedA with SNARE-associated domain